MQSAVTPSIVSIRVDGQNLSVLILHHTEKKNHVSEQTECDNIYSTATGNSSCLYVCLFFCKLLRSKKLLNERANLLKSSPFPKVYCFEIHIEFEVEAIKLKSSAPKTLENFWSFGTCFFA